MADLVIRDLAPEVEAHLRDRAARNGSSMEEEAREALAAAVGGEHEGLGTQITRLFKGIGLRPGEELQRPPDGPWEPPRFDE